MADNTLELIINLEARQAISRLSEMNSEIRSMAHALESTSESGNISGIFDRLTDSTSRVQAEFDLFGRSSEAVALHQQAIKNAMIELVASGVDPASEQIQELRRHYDELTPSVSRTGGIMKSMAAHFAAGTLAITAASAAIRTVTQLVKDAPAAYRVQEKAEYQLSAAVSQNPMYAPGTARRLMEFASALQSVSTYGDEVTISLMRTLIPMGRTEAEIRKIIQTAADMAANGIMSYEAAVSALNMSYSGFAGQLRRQFSELQNLTDEEMANGRAVDILAEKYRGSAARAAETAAGSVEQLANAYGDLKEELGAGIEMAFEDHRKSITKLVIRWTEALHAANAYNRAVKDNSKTETQTLESLQTERARVRKDMDMLTKQWAAYPKYLEIALEPYQKHLEALNAQISARMEIEDSTRETAYAEQAAAEYAASQKQAAEEAARAVREAAEETARWREELYAGTDQGKLDKMEADFKKVLSALDSSTPGTEEFRQWMAIKNKMAAELMDLRGMGQDITGEIAADMGSSMAVTYRETLSGMQSYSGVFNEMVFQSLMQIEGMTAESAAVITNVFGELEDTAFQGIIDATREFGAAMEDGKLSAREFRSILADQAQAILDVLPTLFLQAGLQLIANGQWALGLGFVAAGLTSSVAGGFASQKSSSAKGNVFDNGEMVRFAKGGAIAGTPQHFTMPSGRTAEWAERGYEAIMPLERTADGSLGVRAVGAGSGQNVEIIINNYSGDDVETKESTSDSGQRQIEITIGQYMRSQIDSGRMDKSFSRRYGIKPVGVR